MPVASRRTRAAGFTLIEMMITLVVVVVLLGIAAPSFQKIIANQRIKTASFDLFSALTYARSEAIKRNAPTALRPGASADGAWTTGWRVVDAAAPTVPLRSWAAVPNLTIAESSSAPTVGYGRDGRLTTAAPSFKIDSAGSDFSGLTARCIKVDTSGRPATHTTTHAAACP